MRMLGTVLQVREVKAGADYAAYQRAYILDEEANPPVVRSCRVGDHFGMVGVGQEVHALVSVGTYEGAITCTLIAPVPAK